MDRRNFGKAIGLSAGAAAAASLGIANPAQAAGASRGGAMSGGMKTFDMPKQIKAGLLDVGYAELGPADGPVVVCVHGWPFGIRSFIDAAPLIADRGYHVYVPYLRGYGTTRFLSSDTPRSGQQAALGADLIAFMDALKIEKAVLAGFDWGTTVVNVVAALWPERCTGLVAASGYGIGDPATGLKPLDAATEHNWWYQFYFATQRGLTAMEDPAKRRDLCRLEWELTIPAVDDDVFDSVAVAFDNPDNAAIVVQHYRWRMGLTQGDPRYADLETKLVKRPVISVPTVTLDPDRDPFTAPPGDGSAYRDQFDGPYQHRTLKGIGAHVPQEAPVAFASAVFTADRL
jgi:pimeloyl-ACP methyl ester carboxylesterase